MEARLYIVRAAVPLLLLLAQGIATATALTEEQKGQAIAALEAVAASPSSETTAALYEKVSRADVYAEEWAPAFREYLDKNHFSFAVGGVWRDMIGLEGTGQEAAARAAGAFAATALQSVMRGTPPNLQELDAVLQWLEQCTGFAPPLVATVGMGLDAVLRGGPLDSALLGDTTSAAKAGVAGAEAVPGTGLGAPLAGPPTPSSEAPASAPATVTAVPAAGAGATPSPSSAAGLPPVPVSATPDKTPPPPSLAPPSIVGTPPVSPPKPAEPSSGAVAIPPAAIAPPVPSPGTEKQPLADPFKKLDSTPIPASAFPPPAMQMAITLGYYAGPENIGRWMRLPDVTLRIYQSSGTWVFDGGALASQQAVSLGSLLSSMPTALTGVSVVTMVPLPFALRSPGLVLPVAPVSPELQRPPVALPPGVMLPSIPEFTAMVARTLGDIVQQRELARRPELAKRRDILLLTAEGRANSILAAFLAPGGYVGPEDFFPALTVLWLTGSETALQAASATIDQGEYEGIYALLLLSDLFSGGGDSSLVLATTPSGLVTGSETALRRNFIAPGHAYVTGVAAGGRMFFFDGIEYETLTQL